MNPFATLTSKLITTAILLAVLSAGAVWFTAHERAIGAAGVQAKWDLAKAAQTATALKASESARDTEHQQANDFAGIETGYLQATTHAYPSLSTDLPAALAAGTLRLRNDCPARDRGSVPEATARSRATDAAATAALAQRTKDAIDIVRVSDAGDKRESRLAAQITSLQAVIKAERKQ